MFQRLQSGFHGLASLLPQRALLFFLCLWLTQHLRWLHAILATFIYRSQRENSRERISIQREEGGRKRVTVGSVSPHVLLTTRESSPTYNFFFLFLHLTNPCQFIPFLSFNLTLAVQTFFQSFLFLSFFFWSRNLFFFSSYKIWVGMGWFLITLFCMATDAWKLLWLENNTFLLPNFS